MTRNVQCGQICTTVKKVTLSLRSGQLNSIKTTVTFTSEYHIQTQNKHGKTQQLKGEKNNDGLQPDK